MGPAVISAPEVIIFKDPSKSAYANVVKEKELKRIARTQKPDMDSSSALTKPKTLRRSDYHDILRYGISELKGEERSKARARLAIELGAKPPKSTIKNYKLFLEEQKKEKELKQKLIDEKETIRAAVQKSFPGSKKNKTKKWPKRLKSSGERGDGQIGKYKKGVQFIRKSELSRNKNSERKKHNRR